VSALSVIEGISIRSSKLN